MTALLLPKERGTDAADGPDLGALAGDLAQVTRWIEERSAGGRAPVELEGSREELVRIAERISELLFVLSVRLGTPDRDGADVLELSLQDRRVRLGNLPSIDLSRRRKPWLVLGLLVRERLAAPGRGVPVPALVSAAWPDERILPHSAARRVYSVVQELRKLGLGQVVTAARVGYRLDPRVRVRVVQYTSG